MLFPGKGASSCGCRPAVHHPNGSCTCPSGAAFRAAFCLQWPSCFFLSLHCPALFYLLCCGLLLPCFWGNEMVALTFDNAAATPWQHAQCVCMRARSVACASSGRDCLLTTGCNQQHVSFIVLRLTHHCWLARHSCVNPIRHGRSANVCVAIHHQTGEDMKKLVACAAEWHITPVCDVNCRSCF